MSVVIAVDSQRTRLGVAVGLLRDAQLLETYFVDLPKAEDFRVWLAAVKEPFRKAAAVADRFDADPILVIVEGAYVASRGRFNARTALDHAACIGSVKAAAVGLFPHALVEEMAPTSMRSTLGLARAGKETISDYVADTYGRHLRDEPQDVQDAVCIFAAACRIVQAVGE